MNRFMLIMATFCIFACKSEKNKPTENTRESVGKILGEWRDDAVGAIVSISSENESIRISNAGWIDDIYIVHKFVPEKNLVTVCRENCTEFKNIVHIYRANDAYLCLKYSDKSGSIRQLILQKDEHIGAITNEERKYINDILLSKWQEVGTNSFIEHYRDGRVVAWNSKGESTIHGYKVIGYNSSTRTIHLLFIPKLGDPRPKKIYIESDNEITIESPSIVHAWEVSQTKYTKDN